MPAMLDDPTAPTIYRVVGNGPDSSPGAPLPPEIHPRRVTLRDRVTQATLVPFSSAIQIPRSLIAYLCSQLNKEIEKGDTYPMMEGMTVDAFGAYWFQNFGAIMLLGEIQDPYEVMQMAQAGANWEKECLGSFYIKPNYPGRSSHVCNGGFLTTDGARNRGVGRLMGEGYLDFAPKLGFTYSVFNLVYETNTPSCRIWDALGFKRIGRVKGCGRLNSYPDQFIDAIIYGRDLGTEENDFISEERFERIKFYLKHNKYPDGADRAEKSRLRSASTHYKLIAATDSEPEKLVLKGKEVISDPQRQYDVAWRIHSEQHGGINKTTAIITEKYHWVRIKDTVTQVIKNCSHCKEAPQRALAPYGRKENAESPQVQLHPYNRDYSVPPGEDSLLAHGFTADGETAVQADTPRIRNEDVVEADAERAPEDATFGASIFGTDPVPGAQPHYLNYRHEANSVPVDPELINGVDIPTNFHQLETEVRRLQRIQTFGAPIMAPREMIPESIETDDVTEQRASRRSPQAAHTTTTPREGMSRQGSAAIMPQHSGGEMQDVVYVSQPAPEAQMVAPRASRGTKRKARPESGSAQGIIGSAELRRITRRSAANEPPQTAQNVSDDDWRRQLDG